MTKQDFKKQVLEYLATQKLFPKKVRVYDTRRYGFEVRVYCPPMVYKTTRVSYRKKDFEILKTDEQGRPSAIRKHGSCGHTIKTPMYIHINEEDFKDNDGELAFAVQMIRDSAIL